MLYERIAGELTRLEQTGNFRSIPSAERTDAIDFTSNDYMGIAARCDWQSEFLQSTPSDELTLTSSASRLLAANQNPYIRLESHLSELYGRPALIFNSGYHANTGIISAIADRKTLILADRLVHASIIDGIMLAKCDFTRFHHNDYQSLLQLIEKRGKDYEQILVIVESVYSMDGDYTSIDSLIEIKKTNNKVVLYVDEAHAFGCEGPQGLGLTAATSNPDMVDVVVGTFGKAVASQGAFAIVNTRLKEYLINKSRTFIFSTAIPPISAAWTDFVIHRLTSMESERAHLKSLAKAMKTGLSELPSNGKFTQGSKSAIQPFIVGNATETLSLSAALRADGIKVLPIRTPTVPPATERLRFSLSAAHSLADVKRAINSLRNKLIDTQKL